MTRLVEDLLDSTRVGTGRFRVEMSAVEMIDILSRAVETSRPSIEARHQRLTVRLPPPPVNIQGDPVRLAQIFNNLLDNASQYTQEGGDIALLGELENDALVVTVSDNGIGISPAALASIFELFVQDERPLPSRKSGLGIGLAVVRELVEAHGGAILARSAGRNLGSEFIVTLPLRGAVLEANSSSP
jgi:signal transduction histidine kinase